MAFRLDQAYVEISANLKKLPQQLREAGSLTGRAVKEISSTSEVVLAVRPDLSAMRRGLAGWKDTVKDALEGATAGHLAAKIAPGAGGGAVAGLAKEGADLVADKIVDNLARLRTVVAEAFKGMARVAVLPVSLSLVGLKVGLGVAQALLLKRVQAMTGASTVQMLVGYVAFRVGLGVAKRMLSAAVRTMTRIALVPLRVALGALRSGLRVAVGLVRAAAREAAHVAAVPFRLAGAALSPLGVAAGGLGIGAAIVGAVKAASDLEETINKVKVVFGDASKSVIDDAESIGKRLGLVKADFLDNAAAIGSIGKAAGLTQKEAAKLGVDFVKLAADTSSLYNIPVDDALEKIRAGLVGEAEPLRTLGVLLSEDAVKAQAAAMGFRAVHGQLSEGNKVMARAALITKGLKDASGDLERTSGSLANKVRELWGRVVNLSAEMGKFLLPAAKELSQVFAEIAGDLTDKIQSYSGMFAKWGEQLRKAAHWVGVLYRNFGDAVKLVGSVFGDVAKYLGDALKVAFENAGRYGKYFAAVLGEHIRVAVANAMQPIFGGKVQKIQDVGWRPLAQPMPKFQLGQGANDAFGRMAAREQIRDALHHLVDAGLRGVMERAAARRKAAENAADLENEQAANRARFGAMAREAERKRAIEAEKARGPMRNMFPGANRPDVPLARPKGREGQKKPPTLLEIQQGLGGGLGALGGLAAGGVVAAVAAKAGAEIAAPLNAVAVVMAQEAERQSSEFVGIADFARKIQTGALEKDNLQKRGNDLLQQIVRNTMPGKNPPKVVAVAGP